MNPDPPYAHRYTHSYKLKQKKLIEGPDKMAEKIKKTHVFNSHDLCNRRKEDSVQKVVLLSFYICAIASVSTQINTHMQPQINMIILQKLTEGELPMVSS